MESEQWYIVSNTAVTYSPTDIPFHLRIAAHDKDDYQIIEHLEQCIEFIDKHRQLTNVFVHCYAGVSRSATVVIAYIMRFWKWPLSHTLAFVQAKRVVAKPNDGFMLQLKKYQDMLVVRPNSVLSMERPKQEPRKNSVGPTLTQPTLHMTEQKRTESVRPHQILSSKRHSETPIPRILSSKGGQKFQSPSQPFYERYQQQGNSSTQDNRKTHHPSVQYQATNTSTPVKMMSTNAPTSMRSGTESGYGHAQTFSETGFSSATNRYSQPESSNNPGMQRTQSNNVSGYFNSNPTTPKANGEPLKSGKMLRPKDLPGYRS